MIEIKVKDYCQRCPEFEARSSKQVLFANNELQTASVVVRCQHEEKCKHIMKNAERVLRDRWEKNLEALKIGQTETAKEIARETIKEAEEKGLPWYVGLFNPKLWPDKNRTEEGNT